jgi:hypothetical protein
MTQITARRAVVAYGGYEGVSPAAGDVIKEDTVAPIPKRLILACVLLALLLSCAATVGGAEPDGNAPLPVLEIPGAGVVQVSSEGLLEERFTLPRFVHARLGELDIGGSLRIGGWPVSPGDHRTISVTRRLVYAPDTRILAIEERGVREVPRSTHRHFIGEIDGEPGSGVLVILDPAVGRLTGLAFSDGLSYDLLPDQEGGPTEVRVVATHERVGDLDPNWDCGDQNLDVFPAPGRASQKALATKAAGPLEAVLAIDTDTELMSQKFGGSTTAATNYIADLIAAMNVMYERDLGVTLVQGTTYLRTSSDPYSANSGGSASSTELYEFRNYWGSNYGSVERALAAMLSGKSPWSNSASGIAFVGGLCSTSSGYSFSKVFKINYLSGDAKLVGHEIGHNFGSPHTHCYNPRIDYCWNACGYTGATSCPGGPGTVMSYCHLIGCGSTLDFHPTVIGNILSNHVAPATGVCIFDSAPAGEIFSDGFDDGGTGAWSSSSE